MGYSQFGEEEIVIEFFNGRAVNKGRVLDVGAHDGVSCSNSKRLIELGWGATLVEPSPLAFSRLMQVHAHNPRVDLANVGMVPDETMRMRKFYESGGLFVGTFDDKHRNEWEGKQSVHFRAMHVVGCTFKELFHALPGPYHFISIDVEGTNVELFRALTQWSWEFASEDETEYTGLRKIGAELICVEHQGRVDEILAIAKTQDFVEYALTEANVLLART